MAASIALAFAAMTMTSEIAPSDDGGSRSSPIRLAIEESKLGVLVQVIGLADTACEANYALEVTGSGNRSIQRGSARLQPNAPVTLINLRLAGPSGRDWSAKLSVNSCNGETYVQYGSSR